MTVPAEAITKERIARWMMRFQEAHATPLMLIGVGHDHNSGKVVICTLDEQELDTEILRGFLRHALEQLGG